MKGSSMSAGQDDVEHVVVCNDEGQYSIWFAGAKIPAGWTIAGPQGSREACLKHIAEVWTDMRPRSLRAAMEKDR
jgi:MbtH protein